MLNVVKEMHIFKMVQVDVKIEPWIYLKFSPIYNNKCINFQLLVQRVKSLEVITLLFTLEMGSYLIPMPLPFLYLHLPILRTTALGSAKLRLVLSTGPFHTHCHLLSRAPLSHSDLCLCRNPSLSDVLHMFESQLWAG